MKFEPESTVTLKVSITAVRQSRFETAFPSCLHFLLLQPRASEQSHAGYEIAVNSVPVAFSRALSADSAGEAARIAHLALRTQLKIAALDVFLFQQQVDANTAK
jgi:hypothetical protein